MGNIYSTPCHHVRHQFRSEIQSGSLPVTSDSPQSSFPPPAILPVMTPADFRRIALSLPNSEESSHMGSADFRVGGHIFATLASQKQGYGNLMLTPELQ